MLLVRAIFIAVLALLISNTAISQEAVLVMDNPIITPQTNQSAKSSAVSAVFTARLQLPEKMQNRRYWIDLPNKRVAGKPFATGSDDETVLSFQDSRGSMNVKRYFDRTEIVIHDVDAREIYRGVSYDGSAVAFTKEDRNDYICVEYITDAVIPSVFSVEPSFPEEPVSLAEVQQLQSKPGATNTIFIDYFGGTVTGTFWNANYTNGAAINYLPYDIDNNSGSFSATELHRMYHAWAEMAEDYAPFDVNITTDVSVYNATPVADRSKIIATPSSSWFGNAGGVAVVNGFGSSYTNIGWTWNRSISSMGQTHSHEAGHQMSLRHDGTRIGNNITTYYSGHGEWGPIMGAPFGKEYVQWNNSTYTNAYNQNGAENDLIVVRNKLGEQADDVGDSNGTATVLNIGSDEFVGIIRPAGLGTDTDVFRMDQAGSSTVTLSVVPSVADIDGGIGVNLSMRATLRDSSNAVVAQVGPTFNPLTNQLNFSGALAAGSYYLTIENESPNLSASSGFPEYGNGGYYTVNVSGGAVSVDPELIIENMSISTNELDPNAAFTGQATVRNIGQNSAAATTLTFQIDDNAGFSSPSTLASFPISSLDNGETETENLAANAPSTQDTYYVRACVAAVVNEFNTANNCSAAQTLLVSREVDLSVSAFSLMPANIEPSGDFSVSISVANTQRSASTATQVRILKSDTADAIVQTEIATVPVSPVTGFGSVTVNTGNLVDPGQKGTFYLQACVDTDPDEANTANNCAAAKTLVVDDSQACFPVLAVNGNVAMICL